MKKKVLKLQIGEAFDKSTGKNLPVYASFWEDKTKPGVYSRMQKVFVSEVELPDKEEKKIIEA